MTVSSQRTANRSTGIAVGLMIVFFLVATIGDWEGMEGLALGLMIYFIALLHVPLGIVALVAAWKTGRHARNSWIYLYFGGFAIVALGYAASIGDWDELLAERFEHIADPDSVALRTALRRFNADSAAALGAIEAGADIETRDEGGRTPLMLAASAGFEAVVVRLLDAGAAPDAIADDGANALHYAAAGGMYRHSNPTKFAINVAIVDKLIAAGVDVNAATTDGVTPLIGACTAGSIEVVEALLTAGADPAATPKHGRDCLASAIKNRQPAFIRWLATRSGTTPDLTRALPGAMFTRDPEIFSLLLELGADPAGLIEPNRTQSLAIRLVDDEPPMPAMRAALVATGRAHRAFAGGGIRELREIASRAREPGKLAALLEMGVDPNAALESGDTALHRLAAAAIGDDDLARAQQLLAAGANIDPVNRGGKTPLGLAAGNGRLEMVEFLAAHGADVNYTDKRGNGPLLLAAREGYGYVIEALVAAGARLPPADAQIDYFQASEDHAPGIRSLIAIGLDPNAPGKHGNLPLFRVIRYGDSKSLAAMIEGGARLDVSENGYSPLTAALDSNNDGAIAVLLDAGLDVDEPDSKRRTALELAIGKRALPLTITLLKGGATVTELQRRRIETAMLSDKYRGRGKERKAELRALL